MIIIKLTLLSFLIYALYVRGNNNLMEFLYLMFLFLERGSKSCPPSMDITGLRVLTRNLQDILCFTLVYLSKNVPLPNVKLRQIQLLMIFMYSESNLSNALILLRFYYYTIS
jgi:hypothetical protein